MPSRAVKLSTRVIILYTFFIKLNQVLSRKQYMKSTSWRPAVIALSNIGLAKVWFFLTKIKGLTHDCTFQIRFKTRCISPNVAIHVKEFGGGEPTIGKLSPDHACFPSKEPRQTHKLFGRSHVMSSSLVQSFLRSMLHSSGDLPAEKTLRELGRWPIRSGSYRRRKRRRRTEEGNKRRSLTRSLRAHACVSLHVVRGRGRGRGEEWVTASHSGSSSSDCRTRRRAVAVGGQQGCRKRPSRLGGDETPSPVLRWHAGHVAPHISSVPEKGLASDSKVEGCCIEGCSALPCFTVKSAWSALRSFNPVSRRLPMTTPLEP